jgi:hypothetical protein
MFHPIVLGDIPARSLEDTMTHNYHYPSIYNTRTIQSNRSTLDLYYTNRIVVSNTNLCSGVRIRCTTTVFRRRRIYTNHLLVFTRRHRLLLGTINHRHRTTNHHHINHCILVSHRHLCVIHHRIQFIHHLHHNHHRHRHTI